MKKILSISLLVGNVLGQGNPGPQITAPVQSSSETGCKTDTDIFKLKCSDVNMTITVDTSCFTSSDRYLAPDFEKFFYVSSWNSELSNIDHPNITDSCMMKKVADTYIFEFDIEDCIETNSSNHRVEPGVHVKKGTFIHHTSGAILPNRDNHPHAIYIAQDSIAYTYYIHHQRKIGGVSISAMSPVQVTCLIENNLNEVVTYKPGAESAPANYSMDTLDKAWIPWKLKIEKTGDGDIGDSAIVSLKVNSAAINYHDAFTFAIKNCSVVDFDKDGNRIHEVPLISNYCGSTELGHFLTKDKENPLNNERNSFTSFKMVVFRFADSPELQIECSASVFPKILEDDQIGKCPLHAGGQSGSNRKRRADFEGEYSRFIDFTIDPNDTPDHLYKDL